MSRALSGIFLFRSPWIPAAHRSVQQDVEFKRLKPAAFEDLSFISLINFALVSTQQQQSWVVTLVTAGCNLQQPL